jgi:SH3 domain protein
MYLKIIKPGLLLFTLIATCNYSLAASQSYITDEFEVTLRSGTSTTNEILALLKSGQAVTLVEQDPVSGYSLVITEAGLQGYVLSRYLVDLPSARQRLEQLQLNATEQIQENRSLQAELGSLQSRLSIQQSDNERLEQTLLATQQELDRVKTAAENALQMIEENRTLEASLGELQEQNLNLSEENAVLKDSTRLDWLLRGGGLTLVAFLIGILVTRIRWRKQNSWGAM